MGDVPTVSQIQALVDSDHMSMNCRRVLVFDYGWITRRQNLSPECYLQAKRS